MAAWKFLSLRASFTARISKRWSSGERDVAFSRAGTTLTHAIDLLDHYAPKKGKLLSAKPSLTTGVLLDDTGLPVRSASPKASRATTRASKRISAEESRQRGVIQSLQPWLDLDLPLDGGHGTLRGAARHHTRPHGAGSGRSGARTDRRRERALLCA